MRLKDLLVLLTLGGCTLGSLLAAGAASPRMELRTDRSAYQAGQTAVISLRTHAGGPSDVYLILITPAGKQLYGDQALQFGRRIVAAASNFVVSEGNIEIPLSLATADLARPGEYRLEAYVTPPGAGLSGGNVTAATRFLVTLPGLNFLALHDASSPKYNPNCGGCHVDKTREVHLGPGIPSFHTFKSKMFSAGGINSCTVCHTGADLIDESGAELRKQVAPEFCARCHGALGTGKRLFAK